MKTYKESKMNSGHFTAKNDEIFKNKNLELTKVWLTVDSNFEFSNSQFTDWNYWTFIKGKFWIWNRKMFQKWVLFYFNLQIEIIELLFNGNFGLRIEK